MIRRTVLVGMCLVLASTASAQDRLLAAAVQAQWDTVGGYIVKAADEMPEANYAWKPTPQVRSFGELIAHISDANFGFCSTASGDKSQTFGNTEKTKTSKADIVQALKASVEYCKAVYSKMDDTAGREVTDMMGSKGPRLSVLTFNTNHCWEHYGNVVTYFRLKDMVPPSSRGGR